MVKISLLISSLLISFSIVGMQEQQKAELVKVAIKATTYRCFARSSNLNETCNRDFETRGLLNRHRREKHGLPALRTNLQDCPGK